MYKHAVVGVDFSASWDAVQATLIGLAPRLGLERLTLVYVLEMGYTAAPELQHEDYYRQRLDGLAGSLRERGFEVATELATGRPAAALDEAAERAGADCVVLGSHGYSGWARFFLGSTVLNAARTTRRPLLIVPANGSERYAGPVMLATDGSEAASAADAAFRGLLERGASGVAMHAGPAPGGDSGRGVEASAAARRLEALAELGATTQHVDEDPREAIARIARDEEVSLILVGQRGHNPLAELLMGSTAEAVCRDVEVPILLVPNRAVKQ